MIHLKQTGANISFPRRVIISIIINLVIKFSDVFWDPIVKAYTLSHKRITDSMQPSYRCTKIKPIPSANIMNITNFGKIIIVFLNIHNIFIKAKARR